VKRAAPGDGSFAGEAGKQVERGARRFDPVRAPIEHRAAELVEGEVPFGGVEAKTLETAVQGPEASSTEASSTC
jgi:hypothetical protein